MGVDYYHCKSCDEVGNDLDEYAWCAFKEHFLCSTCCKRYYDQISEYRDDCLDADGDWKDDTVAQQAKEWYELMKMRDEHEIRTTIAELYNLDPPCPLPEMKEEEDDIFYEIFAACKACQDEHNKKLHDYEFLITQETLDYYHEKYLKCTS